MDSGNQPQEQKSKKKKAPGFEEIYLRKERGVILRMQKARYARGQRQ